MLVAVLLVLRPLVIPALWPQGVHAPRSPTDPRVLDTLFSAVRVRLVRYDTCPTFVGSAQLQHRVSGVAVVVVCGCECECACGAPRASGLSPSPSASGRTTVAHRSTRDRGRGRPLLTSVGGRLRPDNVLVASGLSGPPGPRDPAVVLGERHGAPVGGTGRT